MSNYDKNIKALEQKVPLLVKFIEQGKDLDWIEEIKAKNNDVNILIRTTKGPILIHNNDNPKQEAKDKAKEFELKSEFVTIVIGFGTGYLVKELLNKKEKKHVILVIEPVAKIYKSAFKLNDFSEEIKKGDLLFATTKDDIDFQVTLIESLKNVKQWIIPVEDYTKTHSFEYGSLINHVYSLINQINCNTGTIISAGQLMAKNDIESLPYIIRHRGVKELENLYKDKPAIIISTGPSLQKNIHLLMDKKVQDSFILIAVGQALRVLKAYDIKPDFICSVDYGPVNFGHYKGLFDEKEIPLVAINRTYAPIMEHWQGPKFISVSTDPAAKGTLFEFIQQKGALLAGGSVSHFAFGLAIALGCNPIILIGQDLAWEGDITHIPLVDETGKLERKENGSIEWEVTDPRSTIKGKHSFGPLLQVPGYFGNPVQTNIGLASFIHSFERMVANISNKTFINATEGGARIEGMKPLTLEEVIETWTEKINKSIILPLLSFADNYEELINQSIQTLKNDIKDLDDILFYIGKALWERRGIISTKFKNKNKFAKHLKLNYDWTIKAHNLINKNPLILNSIFWANKILQEKKYSDSWSKLKENLKNEKVDLNYFYTPEGKEVLNYRLEANLKILTAAKETTESLKKSYTKVLQEMEHLKKDELNFSSHKNKEINFTFDDLNEYLKANNWAFPLLESKKLLLEYETSSGGHAVNLKLIQIHKLCLDKRQSSITDAIRNYDRKGKDKTIKYNWYVEQGRKEGQNQMGLNQKNRNFKKAFYYLNEAYLLDSKRPDAKWGLATTHHGLGELSEKEDNEKKAKYHHNYAIELFKELVDDYPDNTRFQFELGLIYLRTGKGKEADEIFKDLYQKTNEYDFFLKGLSKLYKKAGMLEASEIALNLYKEKFPFDSIMEN